jgi:UDP-GlcNAc:undecaprenyl-phosphate GlcNAc-1-phosphate transferase
MILDSLIFLTLSISILYLIFWASSKLNYFDLPNNDKIIKKKTPNVAGLGLIFLIICLFLFYDFNYKLSLTLNLTILVIIGGFIDDRLNLDAKYKILVLSIPIIIFVMEVSTVDYLGVLNDKKLNLSSLSLVFSILCFFLLINASNYMDGVDGLLGLLTVFILIFFLLQTNGHYVNLFTPFIIFLLSFLLFNFGILPKQFLGDSGSLGLGFLISSFSIYFTQIEMMIHPSIITWPLAFIVFEFLTINIIRIKNKKNIFEKDLNFIFNILLKKYNLKITLIICSLIQIFYSICGVILNYYEKYEFSLILFLIMFIIYLYVRIKIKKIIYY